MTRTPLSRHFAAAEFDCHNGDQWPPAARDALEYWCEHFGESLRARFGPVTILSGYRPRAYNASVGGAPLSFHRYELRYGPGSSPVNGRGVAADVRCARGNPALWQQHGRDIIRKGLPGLQGRGAAVAYPGSGFTHLDTGPTRTWVG